MKAVSTKLKRRERRLRAEGAQVSTTGIDVQHHRDEKTETVISAPMGTAGVIEVTSSVEPHQSVPCDTAASSGENSIHSDTATTCIRIVHRRGIKINGILYWNPELNKYQERKVRAVWDPGSAEEVAVYELGTGSLICYAKRIHYAKRRTARFLVEALGYDMLGEHPIFDPPFRPQPIFTRWMKQVTGETMLALCQGRDVVWQGPSGSGRTTTAVSLLTTMNAAHHNEVPHAFSAAIFEAIPRQVFETQSITAMYLGVLKRLPKRRHSKVLELATELVRDLMERGVSAVFVDNADVLTPNSLDGLRIVQAIARNMSWRLPLVLIGSEPLLELLRRETRTEIQDCLLLSFTPFTTTETFAMLQQSDPYFKSLNEIDPACREQIEAVYDASKGWPGRVARFVERFRDDVRAGSSPSDYLVRKVCSSLTVHGSPARHGSRVGVRRKIVGGSGVQKHQIFAVSDHPTPLSATSDDITQADSALDLP